MGEEIASDINQLELTVKNHEECFTKVQQQLDQCMQDLKIAQLYAANNAKMISDAAKEGKFSESLVKQLLRQGEDRKTGVEETKLIDLKIKEMKQSQKRQKSELAKVMRNFDSLVRDVTRTQTYVDKIRQGQERVHSTHSACKSRDRDYVTLDQLRRTKQRINIALTSIGEMVDLCRRRDQVLGESLLATQKGKNNQVICKKEVHDNLSTFMGTMNTKENIEDLLLPTEDYETSGAFGPASEKSAKRKSRSQSQASKKGKKRSRSVRSKSQKSDGTSSRTNRLAANSQSQNSINQEYKSRF